MFASLGHAPNSRRRLHTCGATIKVKEDAIDEAAKSVEGAMKVLLTGRGVALSGEETAQPLWNLLRDNGVVPSQTEASILGASRIRNAFGGHGAGAAPRSIPGGIPELAVQAAATAIGYLATLLP